MSQNRIEIVVRHPRSDERLTIQRAVRNVTTNAGEKIEAILYQGRYHRLVRKGRGVFVWSNRPVGVA